jgi:hypothetical protein
MQQLAENETNLRNLEPDIILMRALIADFIERYDLFVDALVAWHADNGNTKPRKVIDIADATRMLDQCGKLIERQHKIEQTGSISLETFRRAIELMGMAVATVVQDSRKIAQIEKRWGSIALDNSTSNHTDENILDAEIIEDDERVDESGQDDE